MKLRVAAWQSSGHRDESGSDTCASWAAVLKQRHFSSPFPCFWLKKTQIKRDLPSWTVKIMCEKAEIKKEWALWKEEGHHSCLDLPNTGEINFLFSTVIWNFASCTVKPHLSVPVLSQKHLEVKYRHGTVGLVTVRKVWVSQKRYIAF